MIMILKKIIMLHNYTTRMLPLKSHLHFLPTGVFWWEYLCGTYKYSEKAKKERPNKNVCQVSHISLFVSTQSADQVKTYLNTYITKAEI